MSDRINTLKRHFQGLDEDITILAVTNQIKNEVDLGVGGVEARKFHRQGRLLSRLGLSETLCSQGGSRQHGERETGRKQDGAGRNDQRLTHRHAITQPDARTLCL